MQDDKSQDYLPISLSSLKTDTKIGCDIYLLVKTTSENRYILYCGSDAVFVNEKSDRLMEKNISRLFIKREDQKKYYEYLENNFHDIVSDTRIPTDEKTKIVHSAATNLIKDLFNDPCTGNIERTKAYAYNMVDYTLKDSSNAESLLKIAVHEYHTYIHSVNVAAVGTLFAKSLDFKKSELKSFCSGILLHDIGKTRISTDILTKKGKLTTQEFAKIKLHPELGVKILKETGIDFLFEQKIALQHHENYDGTGYPYGIKKESINLCGRIARIIDVYDGLTKTRSYADKMKPFAALVEMKDNMLNCFDKELFIEFIRFLGPYDPRAKQRNNDRL